MPSRPPVTKHSILYLEDNAYLTAAVAEYLKKAGYEVDCVHNIEDARDRVANRAYSLALLDLRLTRKGTLDGFQFASELEQRSPSTMLVIFSGCLTPEIEHETRRRNIKVISKPTPLPALRAIISTYLRERYLLHSASSRF